MSAAPTQDAPGASTAATGSVTARRLLELRAEGRAGLVAYLPVGFPTVERSIEVRCC